MTWYVEIDGKRVKEHPSKKLEHFASKYPYLTITAVSIVDELARIADKNLLSENYREQNDQMLLDYLETVSSPEELLSESNSCQSPEL